jgi:prepilin peptidase CpaA
MVNGMDWPGGAEAALVTVLLTFAAWTDVATRIIPDRIAASVALIGVATRLLAGPNAFVASATVVLILSVLLVFLHARGAFGGGDVKLALAICLGLSPASMYRFIFVTAMAGGVLSLLHLMGRRILRGASPSPPPPRGASLLRRVFAAERWRIMRHGSLSYGVAIACGGIWALLNGPGN